MFPELGNKEGNKHNKVIKRTLESLSAERKDGEAPPSPYKATRGTGGGRPKMMSDAECQIAADCLKSGIGSWQAWHEINAWRIKKGRTLIKSRET
eukprot:6056017-Prymnesium_polylepis.1